jgi:hypothetical protein
MMKITKDDYKGFIVGVLASITAVIVWDIIKKSNKLFEHKENEVGQ